MAQRTLSSFAAWRVMLEPKLEEKDRPHFSSPGVQAIAFKLTAPPRNIDDNDDNGDDAKMQLHNDDEEEEEGGSGDFFDFLSRYADDLKDPNSIQQVPSFMEHHPSPLIRRPNDDHGANDDDDDDDDDVATKDNMFFFYDMEMIWNNLLRHHIPLVSFSLIHTRVREFVSSILGKDAKEFISFYCVPDYDYDNPRLFPPIRTVDGEDKSFVVARVYFPNLWVTRQTASILQYAVSRKLEAYFEIPVGSIRNRIYHQDPIDSPCVMLGSCYKLPCNHNDPGCVCTNSLTRIKLGRSHAYLDKTTRMRIHSLFLKGSDEEVKSHQLLTQFYQENPYFLLVLISRLRCPSITQQSEEEEPNPLPRRVYFSYNQCSPLESRRVFGIEVETLRTAHTIMEECFKVSDIDVMDLDKYSPVMEEYKFPFPVQDAMDAAAARYEKQRRALRAKKGDLGNGRIQYENNRQTKGISLQDAYEAMEFAAAQKKKTAFSTEVDLIEFCDDQGLEALRPLETLYHLVMAILNNSDVGLAEGCTIINPKCEIYKTKLALKVKKIEFTASGCLCPNHGTVHTQGSNRVQVTIHEKDERPVKDEQGRFKKKEDGLPYLEFICCNNQVPLPLAFDNNPNRPDRLICNQFVHFYEVSPDDTGKLQREVILTLFDGLNRIGLPTHFPDVSKEIEDARSIQPYYIQCSGRVIEEKKNNQGREHVPLLAAAAAAGGGPRNGRRDPVPPNRAKRPRREGEGRGRGRGRGAAGRGRRNRGGGDGAEQFFD